MDRRCRHAPSVGATSLRIIIQTALMKCTFATFSVRKGTFERRIFGSATPDWVRLNFISLR
jgi:hypothetical protein